MYRLLAIAKYDERYVIPAAHAETAARAGGAGHRVQPRLRGRAGHGRVGPVRRDLRPAAPIAVENFHALADRQRADTSPSRRPGRPRVNLLNWDGKGRPDGLFPRSRSPDPDSPEGKP